MNDKVAVKETQAAEVRPSNLMAALAAAAANPAMDADKMERLFAMHMEMVREERKTSFVAAMGRLAPKLPQITKHGIIFNKDKVTVRSRYAKIEDIDVAIRPLLAEEGFSFSFDEVEVIGDMRKFSATLSHREGHSEIKYKTMPFDKSEYRTACQSENSTISNAKRQLIKMHLNIVEREEDNDGTGSEEVITKDQALDIETMLADTNSNREAFLKLIAGYPRIEDIQQRDMKRIMNALEEKRRNMK